MFFKKINNASVSAILLDALTKSALFGLLATFTIFMLDSGIQESLASMTVSCLRSVFLFSAILAQVLLRKVNYATIIRFCMLLSIGFILGIVVGSESKFIVIGCLFGFSILLGIMKSITPIVAVAQAKNNPTLYAQISTLLYVSYNFGAFISEGSSSILYNLGGIKYVAIMSVCLESLALALALYWLPRYKPIEWDSNVLSDFWDITKSWIVRSGKSISAKQKVFYAILPIFIVDILFYFTYDQIFSVMIVHTSRMNLTIGGYHVLPSQVQLINTLCIILFAKSFSNYMKKVNPCTRHRIGIIFAAVAYLIVAFFEFLLLDSPKSLNCLWDLLPYTIMTFAEILVTVAEFDIMLICIEKRFSSVGMSVISFAVAISNLLAAIVVSFAKNIGVGYFLFLFSVLVVAFFISWHFLKGDALPKTDEVLMG
ncbi:MAG: hypothetical protein JJW01_01710 [Alphaproteobacteria bacterium]|nr:hypothetical protein [Rickettsiales bacterium]